LEAWFPIPGSFKLGIRKEFCIKGLGVLLTEIRDLFLGKVDHSPSAEVNTLESYGDARCRWSGVLGGRFRSTGRLPVSKWFGVWLPTERVGHSGEGDGEGRRFLFVPARFTDNAPGDRRLTGLAVGDLCEESRVGDRGKKASGSGRRSGKLRRFGETTICAVECKEDCLTGESEGSIRPSNATGLTGTRTIKWDGLPKHGGCLTGRREGRSFWGRPQTWSLNPLLLARRAVLDRGSAGLSQCSLGKFIRFTCCRWI